MPSPRAIPRFGTRLLTPALLVASLMLLSGCKPSHPEDNDQAAVAQEWFSSVPELKTLDVSNAEIAELQKGHDVGLSDPSAVALIKLARSHHQPFKEGQIVADLLNAGCSEQTVLELSRLNQLGLWGGQAQALRLVGLSDKMILAVAQRRSQGLPVLSGVTLGELKNAGTGDAQILEMIEKGTSEQDAAAFISVRENAAGHSFTYQGRYRRKN